MRETTNISFYLKVNRIHVFVETLKGIGSPKYICFLIDGEGKHLMLRTYHNKDFHSHRISDEVYSGRKSVDISSKKLCDVLANLYNWDKQNSYRIPGYIVNEEKAAIFYLDKAETIARCEN